MWRAAIIVLLGGLLAGCQANRQKGLSVASTADLSNMPRQEAGPVPTATLLGYCDGDPITWNDLSPSLIELKGGQALSERVLDVGLRSRLRRQGLSISEEDIARERGLLARVSGSDRDEGERVLGKIRQSQGLGDVRFPQMLWRNAAMRRLVQDQVEVPDAVVRKPTPMITASGTRLA